MTPERMLAGLQDEVRVRGLSETVQRPASENETLRSQSTVGAVGTVTMANEVARLNNPTAFSGTEEEYSDWEFALTCFVGTMDGTLLTELPAVAADPRVKRIPTDEAGNERARTLYNIADDEKAEKNGARSTRQKRVRSVPKPRVEIQEQRRTR